MGQISNAKLLLEEAVTKSDNWIAAQHQLRAKKEKWNAAKRELKFYEDLADKRRRYLSKRAQLKSSVGKYPCSSGALGIKAVDNKPGSDSLTNDPLLAEEDDFAPDYNSDSDCSETEVEEPEFFQTTVKLQDMLTFISKHRCMSHDFLLVFYTFLQIFFASRTHSQLTQFCHELQRTEFSKRITMCSLGSRQNLCINQDVTRLKSLSLINEK